MEIYGKLWKYMEIYWKSKVRKEMEDSKCLFEFLGGCIWTRCKLVHMARVTENCSHPNQEEPYGYGRANLNHQLLGGSPK